MTRHFSFAGMQRSGNHAIMDWWSGHFPARTLRNNILGLSCKNECAQRDQDGDYNERIKIDSWENYSPTEIKISNNSEPLIVVLRDPYNWWASLFNFSSPNANLVGVPLDGVIEYYLHYVAYASSFPNCRIIFNHWFLSGNYRRDTEECWDLCESDKGLNHVAEVCCGSSFDGYAYQDQAQNMKVLELHKAVQHLPAYYQPLRNHPELADISRELFDFEPPEGLYE